MRILASSDIKIAPERQRQTFDAEKMTELFNSIKGIGLQHPIVVRDSDEGIFLVAGERRLKALADLHTLGIEVMFDGQVLMGDGVPTVTLGDVNELESEEAELDENIKRANLTWQEHSKAVDRLNTLRMKQAEAKGEKHTITDTAIEVTGRGDGAYREGVRKQLIVSKHLTNPEVAKAKTIDEAFKVLKAENERHKNVELAIEVGKSFTADIHEMYNMDCLEFMAQPSMEEMFDVILTDPPYGMDAQDFGDGAGKMTGIEHSYGDSFKAFSELMTKWSALAFAVAKPQAHAYVFCDIDGFHHLKGCMQTAGWYVFRTPLIHYKPNSGRVPLPDRGPRRQYELILYAIKGKKEVTHIYPDVISSKADDSTGHGAQKPVEVYKNLLQRSVRPGDCVLDSFAGSGTIFSAAHDFKCKAIGVEMDKGSYGICLNRLKELK